VVAVGFRVRVPVADTVPTLGAIFIVVAPVTAHDNVTLSPEAIDDGLAVKAVITGRPAAVTVTTAVFVELPRLLLAVSVYVVVVVGDTDLVPVFDIVPIAWSMDTDVAPLTVHDSVELLPDVMEAGLAVKLVISGGPDGLTVILAVIVEVPVSLTAVIV
jgi:hypothetical protein